VNNFELPIAAERQEVPQGDERTIPRDELGKGRGRDAEIQKVYQMVYGKRK
jgi:hypothetical protein